MIMPEAIPSDHEFAELSDQLKKMHRFAGHHLLHKACTGSTNDDLKQNWLLEDNPRSILIADFQTAGRGQQGRRWLSQPDGQCLCFSFSYCSLSEGFALSLLVGVALINALRSLVPCPELLWLKWPNDVWAGRQKLAGILVESCGVNNERHAVVGIGANLTPLPIEQVNSVSLSELGGNASRGQIIFRILQSLDYFASLKDEDQCLLWTTFAGSFWATRFQFPGDNEIVETGMPAQLFADGSLAMKQNNGKLKLLVSGSIIPMI